MRPVSTDTNIPYIYGATTLALSALFFLGLLAGHQWTTPEVLWNVLQGQGSIIERVSVLELRLPRNLLAMLGGAALGAAGAIMQGVTRNSLASPGLTGSLPPLRLVS